MKRTFSLKKTSLLFFAFFILYNCYSKSCYAEHVKFYNQPDSLPLKGFLFGDDQSYPECHASTIIHLKNGEFVAAWFGGTEEKNDDVGIWMTKGKPGAWGKTFEVAKINNTPHWNPVLFQSPEGKIYLFFKTGKEIPQWETLVKTSDD